jgi:hypothetical protein
VRHLHNPDEFHDAAYVVLWCCKYYPLMCDRNMKCYAIPRMVYFDAEQYPVFSFVFFFVVW